MLIGQAQWHPEHRFLLQQCRSLLDWEGWESKVSHCFRETNQVADILANMGSEGLLGVQIHSTPPKDVWEALYADSVGVYLPRRCRS